MSYFIKDGGTAFSDLEGSFEGVTFKPIKEVYSAYLSPIDKTLPPIGGSHSPWFCVKDGRYPLFNLTYDDGNVNTAIKGWDLPIMSCTISSLSGRYYLTGLESNGYYGSYQLPQQHFGYFKKDVLVKDNNGNIKMNIGCDHIVNNNGNKLRWTIPITAFDLYLNDGLTTKHDSISNKTNIFYASYRKDNFKTLNKSLTAADGPDSYVEANLKNRFDIVNNAPVADTNKFGYQLMLSNDTNFEVSTPPCFRLNVSDIKAQGYSGLKITISGYSNYTSSFSTELTADYMKYYVDTKFIQHGNNLFVSDPYSMHFFYQFTNNDSWDSNSEFSGSVSAKYQTFAYNKNLTTAKSFSGSCTYTPICLNSNENAEIQNANTIEFWEHVIPITIQNYEGDNADTKYYKFNFNGNEYITPYSSYYNKQQDKTISLERFNIDYSNYSLYGLKQNEPLDKTKSWTSISSRFCVWAPQESYDNSFLPFGHTYSNSKQSECKATLVTYSSDYPKGYKEDWCSILTGSNHYTFGRVWMSALIELTGVNAEDTPYLYITLPATTLFLNEEGPTSEAPDGTKVLSSTHKGLLYQLEMTYEGTN